MASVLARELGTIQRGISTLESGAKTREAVMENIIGLTETNMKEVSKMTKWRDVENIPVKMVTPMMDIF